MNPVFVNDVLQRGPKQQFVVIGLQKPPESSDGEAAIFVLELDVKNPLPIRWTLDDVKNWHQEHQLKVVERDLRQTPPTVKAADIEVRDLRWQRIAGLVRKTALYDRTTRNKLLKEHACNIGCAKETLLDDLRRYWLNGQTKDALLGDFWRCGHLQDEDPGVLVVERKGERGEALVFFAPGKGAARGRRPAEDKSYVPMAMPSALRKKVLEVAKKHYLEDERRSVRATTDHVVRKLFTLRDENGKLCRGPEGEALLKPLGQRPTEHQIRYLLRKAVGPSEAFRQRVGSADHDNNHAAATGSINDDCVGAGDVYEIDATFIDLWLVAEADHRTIIGKATLYLVVDRQTRLIVGFYMSLENPQWEEAKQAILSICGDWEDLCKRLGVAYRPEAFPARGVFPNRFVADRAELLAFKSDILCDGFEQQVTNAPSKKSKSKSCVEGSFHETNVPIKDTAPGYEFPKNARKRQGKKYDKDASLTLTELARIYLELVTTHNLKVRSGMVLSPDDVYKDWKATPANMWQRDIERMSAPARHKYEYVRQKLTPVRTASVKRDGIHFLGLVYTFDEARQEDWFARASIHHNFDVTVAYSPSLVDNIVIHDPFDKRKTYKGHLTSDYVKRFTGYSFAEVQAYRRKLGAVQHEGAQDNQAHRIGLAETIAEIGEASHDRMKAATKDVKHGTRYRDSVAIRKAEAKQRRQSTHNPTGAGAHIVGTVEGATPTVEQALVTTPSTPSSPAHQPRSPGPASAPDTPVVRDADATPNVLDDLLELIES